jgi:5'(3')-deoxyribonucleotidase
MKIAVDLDNTLADTTSILLKLTNWKMGTNFVLADVNEWDFWRNKGPAFDKAFWDIYDFLDTLYIRRTLPPVHPLACPIVKMMEKAGHTVHIVTANKDSAKPGIEAWLFGHGLDTPVMTIGRVSAEEKVKMDYNLYIDDSPKFIEPMRLYGNGGKLLILLDQPWNAAIDVSEDKNIIRAANWRDIQSILEHRGIL